LLTGKRGSLLHNLEKEVMLENLSIPHCILKDGDCHGQKECFSTICMICQNFRLAGLVKMHFKKEKNLVGWVLKGGRLMVIDTHEELGMMTFCSLLQSVTMICGILSLCTLWVRSAGMMEESHVIGTVCLVRRSSTLNMHSSHSVRQMTTLSKLIKIRV
jgi:hypothetical protein